MTQQKATITIRALSTPHLEWRLEDLLASLKRARS